MEGIAATPKADPMEPESPATPSGSKHQWWSSKQSLPITQIPPAEEEEAPQKHPHKRLTFKRRLVGGFLQGIQPGQSSQADLSGFTPHQLPMEGSHDLSSVFHKIASSAHLLDSSIFEVQDS